MEPRLRPDGNAFFEGAVPIILAVISAVVSFLFIVPAIIELPNMVSRNYNEGWGALHAQRLAAGLPLYPAADSLIANNYPPLWYLLLAVPEFLGWDVILFGRICALLSQLTSSAVIAAIALTLTGRKSISITAGLFFLGGTAAWLPTYVAMNDPQWSACALMLTGMYCAIRADCRASIIVAAGLVVLGGFVKHSGLAIPIGVTAYLIYSNKSYAWHFVRWTSLISATGLMICTVVFGTDFLTGMFAHVREIDPRLSYWLILRSPLFFFFVVITIPLVFLFRNESVKNRFVMTFLLVAFATGLVFTTGAGVGENVYFETWAALAVAFAVLFDRRATVASASARAMLIMPVVLTALLIATAASHWRMSLPSLATLDDRIAASFRAISTVREFPGRVACETGAICYWAGKPTEMDFFNVGQRLAVGKWSTGQLLNALSSREIRLFLFDVGSQGASSERFTQEFNCALRSQLRLRPQLNIFDYPIGDTPGLRIDAWRRTCGVQS